MKFLFILESYNQSFLSGNQRVTFFEYEAINVEKREMPLFCGLNYNQVDLRFITAIQELNQEDCKKCIEVYSPRTNKKIFLLGVDRGGRGLDMSKFAFTQLFDQNHLGLDHANWNVVDDSHCAHIYKF